MSSAAFFSLNSAHFPELPDDNRQDKRAHSQSLWPRDAQWKFKAHQLTQPHSSALSHHDRFWLQGYFTSHSNLFLVDIMLIYSILNGFGMSQSKIMCNCWNKSPIRNHLEQEYSVAKFVCCSFEIRSALDYCSSRATDGKKAWRNRFSRVQLPSRDVLLWRDFSEKFRTQEYLFFLNKGKLCL